MRAPHIGYWLIVCCVCLPAAQALDHFVVGPRAQGMAGSTVASVNDETAQYYNPAAFGFLAGIHRDENDPSRVFGLGADTSVGYRITGALSDLIDEIGEVDIDRLGNIGAGSAFTRDDLDQVIRLISLLPLLDDPGNQVQVAANGGAGLQIGRFAVGARTFGSFTAWIQEIDTQNLGFDFPDMVALSDSVEDANTAENILPAGYTNQYLTGDQATRLDAVGYSPTAVSVFDYFLNDSIESGVARPSLISDYVDLLIDTAEVVAGTDPDGGSIGDNATAVAARGLAWLEIPVSYGHAINEHLAIGVTGKFMRGRIYGVAIRVFDENVEIDEVLSDARDTYRESTAFGIDAGVMVRYNDWRFGLVGRNLNSPTFEGFQDAGIRYPDAELEPELVAGAAWRPLPTLSLEGSLDLLEKDGLTEYYSYRYASVGAEWDVGRIVALRGGLATNLAESDIGTTVDAGIGLNLGLLRLDLAIGMALDSARIDGQSVPKEGHASLGLSSRW